MEIDNFKQELYNRVLEVANIKPSNVDSLEHGIDTIYINVKEGTRIGIAIFEDDDYCNDTEIDVFNNINEML